MIKVIFIFDSGFTILGIWPSIDYLMNMIKWFQRFEGNLSKSVKWNKTLTIITFSRHKIITSSESDTFSASLQIWNNYILSEKKLVSPMFRKLVAEREICLVNLKFLFLLYKKKRNWNSLFRPPPILREKENKRKCHIQDPDDDEVQVVGDLFIRKT